MDFDWTLGSAAGPLGEQFKSLQTAIQECCWFDGRYAAGIVTAIANEENT